MQGSTPLVTATVPFTFGLDYTLALVKEGGRLPCTSSPTPTPRPSPPTLAECVWPTWPASPDLSVGTTAPLTRTLAALSYGEIGDYQVVAAAPTPSTSQRRDGNRTAESARPALGVPGAATLYLVDDGVVGLRFIGSQDAAVDGCAPTC